MENGNRVPKREETPPFIVDMVKIWREDGSMNEGLFGKDADEVLQRARRDMIDIKRPDSSLVASFSAWLKRSI